ncbi:pilus assembly protein [Lichenicola cladoniae]|uniref:Pilus assembly protein n=1 Tax=Lichenicola cladoniae TaxID=1484109 RepID=A0A6M8HLY9_9PROT|nr:cellulose synthase operon protein YhjQ/BcsQ [Lichenicola cladoniae]NPD69966.1 pilus assembly protein [Acetobacteraceae bacterium]QKE89384.1 pilus assembly protein [Lichenicola cladoniae]
MSEILTQSNAAKSGNTEAERHDRAPLMAFIGDGETEAALREGLADLPVERIDIRRGGIKAAIAALRKTATPHVLIVDVGGEKHPLTALGHLSEVVEPDVRVLVIGDAHDVDTYRQITRGLGAVEYLSKPVTRERVSRHFLPIVTGELRDDAVTTGRVLTVTGVVGGVGATTIAANLAWHFAMDAMRHTVLLDPDLHLGDAALLLDVKASPGLRAALEAPDRIDALFVERATQPIMDGDTSTRLHVLAGEETLSNAVDTAPDAASRLIEALGRRYNMIVVDVPAAPVTLYRDLLKQSQQRILVMPPTLSGIRATLRLLAIPQTVQGARRPVIVLNRVGLPGGLNRRQVEEGLKMPVDIAIADLPRQMGQAATMGMAAAATRGIFRNAVAELAQQVAFIRLLDSTIAPEKITVRGARWHLFGAKP